MKFLADENIPILLIGQLQEKGWDVKHIGTKHAGISDEQVLELANIESRVLITFDSDFGDLIFKDRKIIRTGIIFFRLGQFMPDEPGKILLDILAENKVDFFGKISVVTKETVRQRKLMQ